MGSVDYSWLFTYAIALFFRYVCMQVCVCVCE